MMSSVINQTEGDNLELFVVESFMIEGILSFDKAKMVEAHKVFLDVEQLSVLHLCRLAETLEPRARLRTRPGMNVRIGSHFPPPGGPGIAYHLDNLLQNINAGQLSPWEAHCRYEELHPFLDGNGRSGRVLWLWMHTQQSYPVPPSFLRLFYYETLNAYRRFR